MRIVIVAEVYLPKIDGVVIRTMNLIRQLTAAADEVLVVCPEVEGRPDSSVPLCEFRSFPFPAYPEYRIGLPDKRLVDVIEDYAPDVIHYLNPFAFGFRCHDVLREAGVSLPSVFSFHTLYGEFVKRYAFLQPLSRLLWWLTRDYHNAADANLTVSTIMQDDLIERGFERVALWPPAVDSTLFHPGKAAPEVRSRLSDGHPELPLLLTVSRLASEKNVAFLAEVMQQLPEVRLAIIGDGPQRAELERRFAGTNTQFLGYLKGEQLAAAYASADLFVYSSETETMGNVVLEAMASGLPVVVPRAGGIPSLVRHQEDGVLYAPRDAGAAASSIRELLDYPPSRQRIGQAARDSAAERSWKNSIARVRQYYADTIAQHRSGSEVEWRRSPLAPLTLSALILTFRVLAGRRGLARSQRADSEIALGLEAVEGV